jgi:hypothetical protein
MPEDEDREDVRALLADAYASGRASPTLPEGPLTLQAQAALAIKAIAQKLPFFVGLRDLLELPADTDRRPTNWQAALAARLDAIDAAIVCDAWLDATAASDEHGLATIGARIVCRLPTLAPFVERMALLLLRPRFDGGRRMLVRALIARCRDEPELFQVLGATLTAPEVDAGAIKHALEIVASLPPGSPRALAFVAALARRERARRSGAASLPRFIQKLASPALLPTALIGLDGGLSPSESWACAVAASDSAGVRHLLQRLSELGWSRIVVAAVVSLGAKGEPVRRTLLEHADPEVRWRAAEGCVDPERRDEELAAVVAGVRSRSWPGLLERISRTLPFATTLRSPALGLPPPPSPLEALTSRSADLRRRALVELQDSLEPDHLLALLLGAALDRCLSERTPGADVWRLNLDKWLTAFLALGGQLDRTVDEPRCRVEGPSLRAQALDDAVRAFVRAQASEDAVLAFVAIRPTSQRLTPELEELRTLGPRRFALRYPPPTVRLDAEERAELLAAEAALAASA